MEECAFCESKIGHVAYGDVEHFRPKAGFRQRPTDPLTKPGYYWLAYEWANLLLSCQICNQRHKRNLFPLQAPEARARSHRDDVGRERPLLIDPSKADPERHISFRSEVAYAVEGSVLGKTTIEALGLNREVLRERRMELLVKLEDLIIQVVQILLQLVLMDRNIMRFFMNMISSIQKKKSFFSSCHFLE